jgi:glycerophosphoryl diester phosphodiesterase
VKTFLAIAWLAGATALAASEAFPFFEPIQPPRRVQVIAHRGEAGQAPENSRAALVRCVEDGIEWAEVDVRRTRDGQHVIWHDATVLDSGGRKIAIAEGAVEDLKKIDVGSRFAARFAEERILSLTECFAVARGKLNLYLDCKAVDPEQLAREILAAGMERQVVIYDSTGNLARAFKITEGRAGLMAKWRRGSVITNGILNAVEINADEVSEDVCQRFHALGVKVQIKCLDQWDNSQFWAKAMDAGADWIQTDLPEEVRAFDLWRHVPKRPVRISLHRGANRYAPENTLPAFEKAIRLGADFVEFDVRTTRDGKFYLLHDSLLDGKTDGRGPIAETLSGDVEKLSAGVKFGRAFADVRLPTLEQFLTAVEGKVDLYFDAKAISPEAPAEAVARHGMAERTVVYQSLDYLKRLRAIDSRIRALPPLDSLDELEKIAEFKPYAVDAKWTLLSREMIARCHSLGIQVFSDALGAHERVEDYSQAIDWGIDVIQTDHPLRLMRAVELRARR